jgi:hypothetical protein
MLTGYNPCNRRACPMCEWRRSRIWRGRLLHGLDAFFAEHPTHKAVFLTLTVRNVPLGELADSIKHLHASWDRLQRCAFFPTAFWFRRTEVTISRLHGGPDCAAANVESKIAGRRHSMEDMEGVEQVKAQGPAAGWGPAMAHPHIHALLLVPASYFSNGYVRKTEWQQQWMMAARLDYAPIIDIRRASAKWSTDDALRDAKCGAIEAMKYTVKATDMLKAGDDLPEFIRQMRSHHLVAASRKLRKYLPTDAPNVAELRDERIDGLMREHPGVMCLAQWDAASSSYTLTPRA